MNSVHNKTQLRAATKTIPESTIEEILRLIDNSMKAFDTERYQECMECIQKIVDISMKTQLRSVTRLSLAIETSDICDNRNLTNKLMAELKAEIINLQQ